MTNKEIKKIAAEAKIYEQATFLQSRIERLLAQNRALMRQSENTEWLIQRQAELYDDFIRAADTARATKEARDALRDIIRSAPDEMLQLMLSFRYEYGFTWAAVAMRMGGGNSPDSARKQVERYLRTVKSPQTDTIRPKSKASAC